MAEWLLKRIERLPVRYLIACLIPLFISGFQQEIIAAITMGRMMLAGEELHCPIMSALRSCAMSQDQNHRTAQLQARARLIEQDSAGLELYQLGSEKIWITKGGLESVCREIAEQADGIYEHAATSVRPGDVVLDGGANVGLYSRHALMKGAAKVIAIEPVPANLECLRRNLADEIAAGKVLVYAKGIWDKDDVMQMYLDPGNPGAHSFVFSFHAEPATMTLPLTTVDQLVGELGLDRVDFIKLDIEGSERRALMGARETIRRFHPGMAVCVYHLADDPLLIPRVVREIETKYKSAIGPCVWLESRIRPQVLFYSYPTLSAAGGNVGR